MTEPDPLMVVFSAPGPKAMALGVGYDSTVYTKHFG